MTAKELNKATRFGALVETDAAVRRAFISDPVRAMSEHAGIVLSKEENAAVANYIKAAKALSEVVGYQEPTQRKKAPWYLWGLQVLFWYYE
jgi:hypothetical protein